jgi:hypothetical protein
LNCAAENGEKGNSEEGRSIQKKPVMLDSSSPSFPLSSSVNIIALTSL